MLGQVLAEIRHETPVFITLETTALACGRIGNFGIAQEDREVQTAIAKAIIIQRDRRFSQHVGATAVADIARRIKCRRQ